MCGHSGRVTGNTDRTGLAGAFLPDCRQYVRLAVNERIALKSSIEFESSGGVRTWHPSGVKGGHAFLR
jgi:hypothetical protein